MMRFSKYEGLGNDFVIVEGAGVVTSAQALAICDRHLGVGADGVLLVDPKAPSMAVINADGSVPEMCGNGLRCVAQHLVQRHGAANELSVQTDAGPHHCSVTPGASADHVWVEVSMAVPSLEATAIPLDTLEPMLDEALQVLDRTLRLTAVSMGNPHGVCFDDVGEARMQLGPALGAHPRFVEGVNVGFARMRNPRHMTLHVFERGSGWTRACGTGACAAVVAAVETGRSPRNQAIAVELPGGTLTIVVGDPGQGVSMTGPARRVFDGELQLTPA